MVTPITASVGRRGAFVIPAAVRERYGISEGSLLILEDHPDGILVRPARAVPVEPERYSLERKAELLLNNAVDEADYRRAVEDVRELGVDPETIPHRRPGESA